MRYCVSAIFIYKYQMKMKNLPYKVNSAVKEIVKVDNTEVLIVG